MRSVRSVSLVLLAAGAAACHTMRPMTLESLPAQSPGQVWVTRTDQSVVLVEAPRVVNNGLVGLIDGKYNVIPVAEVHQVAARRIAPAKTAILVGAGALAAGAVLYLVSGTGDSLPSCASTDDGACMN